MGKLQDGRVAEHIPAMMRYARALLRGRDGAEDLVHDALVSAYANAAQYRPDRPLGTWLLAIVHNRFVSDLRRAGVRESHRADLAAAAPAAHEPEQEIHLRLVQIEHAFLALSDEQRAALHLVAVEGLAYQEAAEALGIPIGTLISRISRAREKLRQIEDGQPGQHAPGHLRVVGGDKA